MEWVSIRIKGIVFEKRNKLIGGRPIGQRGRGKEPGSTHRSDRLGRTLSVTQQK